MSQLSLFGGGGGSSRKRRKKTTSKASKKRTGRKRTASRSTGGMVKVKAHTRHKPKKRRK